MKPNCIIMTFTVLEQAAASEIPRFVAEAHSLLGIQQIVVWGPLGDGQLKITLIFSDPSAYDVIAGEVSGHANAIFGSHLAAASIATGHSQSL